MSLSAREGAGLYLVRRARTLTAPHQVRLVVTAFLAVLVVDLVRIYLVRLGSADGVALVVVGCEALTYLAVALVLWHPVGGLALAGVALLAGQAVGGTGLEPALLMIMGTSAGLRSRAPVTRGFLIGLLGVIGFSVMMRVDHAAFVIGWFVGAALAGLAFGAGLRRLNRRRTLDQRDQADVVTEDARIRADERRVLARELHDVVTHHLANASLQLMSRADATDAESLRKTLRRVAGSVSSAQTELRLLVKVLRDDPATAAGANEVNELSQRLPPTEAAASWARRLAEAGFDPAIDVPAIADHLQLTVQNTIARTVAVACGNIVAHAPDRATCCLSVSVNDSLVVVRAANSVDPVTETTRLGWGLRELRERADLTGGTFSAGRSSDAELQWVVVVTIPRD